MTIQVLVAPAAFKGTLGPRQVAEALSAGVRRAVPDASLLQVPIADGGDGLLDAVLTPGSLREQLAVTGPLGTPVRGVLGWVDAETAIFESATASGIALLRPDELDPLRATTRGVGELIWEATERGAKVVVVGLGGTATVDGGTGAGRRPDSGRVSRSSPRPAWCRAPSGSSSAWALTRPWPSRTSS